jgi:hypothetical protein
MFEEVPAGGLLRDLSSYVFSPLREGDITFYRGFADGLGPVLLAAVVTSSS